MSKYGAKKTVIDGIKFDSKMEGDYYLYIKKQKEDGKIKDFSLQPEFILQPKFEKDGKKYLPIKYKSDFKVMHNDGTEEIIDIKGFSTADFKIKAKLFNYNYKEKLILLTYVKKWGGWIELDELAKLRKQSKKA